jgi:hypothetical protein|tara:strand:+ start:628 stop:3669 length:3042 start_codon:yes stop_codon:yes gene_type:complete
MGFMDKMKVKAAEMRARAHSVVNSPGHASDGFRSAETTPVRGPTARTDGETPSAPSPVANGTPAATRSPAPPVELMASPVVLSPEISRALEAGRARAEAKRESAGGEERRDEDFLLDGLERGYFEEPSTSEPSFDPVLVSLNRLGSDFTVEDLSKEEERLSELVERVSTALNKEILAHGEDFEKGMNKIAEIHDALEASGVLLSNSRRLLKRVGADVKSALRVQGSHTTKGSITGVLEILENIKFCQMCETKIRSRLDVSEYAEAMSLYSKAWMILENMHALTCTSTLREDFVALRWELVTCVDNVLIDLCGTFDAAKFTKLYDTYPKLGPEVKHLADKIQDAFLKAVEMQTEGMLRLHAMLSSSQDEADTRRKNRMGYKQLCSQLSPMQFVPCLRKTLECLHEIFLSSYKMTEWCETTMREVVDGSDTEAINTCSALIAALEINRKPIVEMASVRLAALLQASAAPSNAAFREVFDMCRVFINCAEAFCGEESRVLRAQLERIGDRYFESLHSARLDATKTVLENEPWIPVSSEAVRRVRDDLRNALQRGQQTHALGTTLGDTVITGFSSEQDLDAKSFAKYVDQPNPFADDAFSKTCDGAEADETDSKTAEEEVVEDDKTQDSALEDVSNESSEHAEETVGKDKNGAQSGLDQAGAKITASSLYILQGIVEYLALMQVMRPSVPVIFNGICQLFELALVKTFNAFGRTEALLPDCHDMTPRLRGTLSRLGNSGGVMAIRPTAQKAQGSTDMLSDTNFYGLKERDVALESLLRVADEFKRIKTRVKRSLPLKDAALADRFYSHTVAAADDLREHVFKNVASLLLNIEFCSEAIGDGDPSFALVNSTFAGKYNVRDAPTRHNKWVDDVQAELLRFTTKLACADVAPDALTILWRQAASVIQDALVDGFSRVKKCTDAGRALMTLDVKTLRTEFTKLAPPSASVEWRYVDTYIDAFYVPESEARRWMAVHPEFSKAHKTALAHQVSAARRWSAKLRADLLTAIDDDDDDRFLAP